jgi:hypothetical protein
MATLKLTLKTRENAKELDRIGIETVIDVKAAMKLRPLDDPGIMFQNSKSLLLVRFTDKIIEARSGRNIILSAYYPRKLAGIFVPTQRARIIDDFKEDANHTPYEQLIEIISSGQNMTWTFCNALFAKFGLRPPPPPPTPRNHLYSCLTFGSPPLLYRGRFCSRQYVVPHFGKPFPVARAKAAARQSFGCVFVLLGVRGWRQEATGSCFLAPPTYIC